MKKQIKVGDFVKYIEENDDEKDCIFEMMEINGDRGIMALVTNHTINPTFLVKMSDIELVRGRYDK